MIDVKQNNDEKHGSFEALIDGKKAGLMTYTWAGEDRFIIDHTEVEEAYNGKGVGKEMLIKAVEFARENGNFETNFQALTNKEKALTLNYIFSNERVLRALFASHLLN